jgi:hypothetical protein
MRESPQQMVVFMVVPLCIASLEPLPLYGKCVRLAGTLPAGAFSDLVALPNMRKLFLSHPLGPCPASFRESRVSLQSRGQVVDRLHRTSEYEEDRDSGTTLRLPLPTCVAHLFP